MVKFNDPVEPNGTCDSCGDVVLHLVTQTCWKDEHTQDHAGLCCDCYDVTFGQRPPIKLGLKTATNLHYHDELDE